MSNLAMKVVLLFKALAMLFWLGFSIVAVSHLILPFILPGEFVIYYGIGAIGVIVMVAVGAFLNKLRNVSE